MNDWQNFFNKRVVTSDDPAYSADFTDISFLKQYKLVETFLKGLNLPHGSRLLDCGCGVGSYLELANNSGIDCIGLDFSFEMIKRVNSKGFASSLGSIEKLPFKDKQFDIILSISVLQYLSSAENFFAECSHLLKPGGRLFLTTLFSGSLRVTALKLLSLPDKNAFGFKTLRPVLMKNSFEIVDSGYLYCFPKGLDFLSYMFNRNHILNRTTNYLANAIYLEAVKV